MNVGNAFLLATNPWNGQDGGVALERMSLAKTDILQEDGGFHACQVKVVIYATIPGRPLRHERYGGMPYATLMLNVLIRVERPMILCEESQH